jgi:transcriptional regulator with XRE-family HTH domain
MHNVNSRLSRKLKELRGKRSLYQVEQESGISRSLIRRYEAGEHTPEDAMLKRIAGYYEVGFRILRKLQLEDEFPSGSEKRQILLEWIDEIREAE